MLTGVSSSGDSAAVVSTSGFSEDERGRTDDGGRSSGGNRWPRQETLYLLKIRSDMDAAFRDSSLKGPLWDEVSRKLATLGFHRSAKKCKEKFENVYKYHKRIKEGRSSKADGKTYKFFEQLQALEASPSAGGGGSHQPPLALPPPSVSPLASVVTPISGSELQQNNNNNKNNDNVDPISVAAPSVAVAMPNMNVNQGSGFSFSELNMSVSNSTSSNSGYSDDELREKRRGRKRKWKEFFGRLMKEVVEKQEELQSKFLDALERRERDRMAREEAWRLQEMAKMKREHELLVQERSMVAAKDAAVITFLQKITEQNPNAVIPQMPAMQLLQQQHQQQQQPAPTLTPPQLQTQPTPPTQPQPQPEPQQQAPPALPVLIAAAPVSVPTPASAPVPPPPVVKNLEITGENTLQPSPSRWPKAEINALIQIRTSLDTKYQENGPKGPLWEEVSAAMRNLGYNRNAKRCKEKWENINKYYKKVKESSKKRPEDSKTCPYFHQLDAIYREKAASGGSSSNNNSNINPGLSIKPVTQMAPIMARPEQQWPLPAAVQEHQYQYQQKQQQQQQQHQQNADLNEDDYDDEDDDDDDEDEEGGEYEIVPNKTSSMASAE